MTSWPCSASSAAATDESTPPDIATTIRILNKLLLRVFVAAFSCRNGFAREAAKFLHQSRQHLNHAIDFFVRRHRSEAEAELTLRAVCRRTHGAHDLRR